MLYNHAPFRLTALGAFVLSLSACGGGGGGTVPTTSYTPTATTTTTTRTAPSTSSVAPIVYCCDPAASPATLSEMLQLNGGVSNGFAITTHLNLPGTASDPGSVKGGGTSASPASVTVNASGAVDTLTLSTVNAAAWANTMVYDSNASADRLILWFDVWDSSALLDFTDWTDPNNIQIAHTYFDTGAADQPDATVHKYQYMAWGWWLTADYATTDPMIDTVEGFFVVGKPTAPGNIPTTGTATYSGETSGQALDGATFGIFNATADFQNRAIAVSSTNTILDQGTGTFAAPQYDFNGTLSYAAGVNQFNGTISNSTSGMAGTATGMFYGPAAEEIGGVFEITNGSAAVKGLFVAN